jgi:hypothetical protein
VTKRRLTPGYVLFFILFWPDTYRILIGLLAAVLLAPRITPLDQGAFVLWMMYIMLACIGYAATDKPARAISGKMRRILLKDRRP